MYGHDPEVITIHAGLECGLFLGKRPDLDCVSFGPDIPDVHLRPGASQHCLRGALLRVSEGGSGKMQIGRC